MSKYFDDDKIEGLTIRGRETGVRKLMATNLLKRFESSVHSFRMTLDRVLGYMSDTVGTIDSYEEYRAKHYDTGVLEQIDIDRFDDGFDLDQDDTESMDPDEFATKGKTRFLLSDMDWRTWRDCILRDMDVIHRLLDMVAGIDAAHDAKLQRLYRTISDKQNQPINPAPQAPHLHRVRRHRRLPVRTRQRVCRHAGPEHRGGDRHESGTLHGQEGRRTHVRHPCLLLSGLEGAQPDRAPSEGHGH